MNYQQHPLSAAYPKMSEAEFISLKDSVHVNGVLNAITLYEGMVIDGWHRYRAATELLMECPEQQLDSWIDPVEYVRAQNKHRRHLTDASAALAEVAINAWVVSGSNQHSKVGGAGTAPPPKTVEQMAQSAGVSKRTIQQAKVVQEKAAPEVKEAVKQGKVGLEKAVAISKLTKEEQAAAIEKPVAKKSQVADFKAKQEEKRQQAESQRLEVINHSLQDEVDRLRETLALDDLPEFERIEAKDIIDRLRQEVADLKKELATVKSQRDEYMAANVDMQRHLKRLNKA